jgi:hypothetical protein
MSDGSKMFASLLKLWKQFPVSIRERIYLILKPTGIPYFMSYMVKYNKAHNLSNFAGDLLFVKEEYLRSTGYKKKLLSDQFDEIIDNLVMKNGVKKTTYSMRQNSILSRVLSEKRCRIKKYNVKVLDVPSSVGTASLDVYKMLRKHYTISSYLLGDLYFNIYYDRDRECIYDEEGNLLQVKLRRQFFSIYRPQTSGDEYKILAYFLLIPLDIISWYLKKKYRYEHKNKYELIVLIHPDVECELKGMILNISEVDVFKSIEGKFDMIISFNLLQKNYFPTKIIQIGTENLKNALREEGLLIMGNTEHFSVSKKINGELLLIDKEGEF